MFDIKFKDYPSGSWATWPKHEVLSKLGSIKRRLESENAGEAGVVMFDKLSSSFYYSPGNAVHNAFETDLTSKNRYLLQVDGKKEDGTPVKLFEGQFDFKSLYWPDLNKQLQVSVIDKLSALKDADQTEPRVSGNLLPDLNNDPTVNQIYSFYFGDTTTHRHKWFGLKYRHQNLDLTVEEKATTLANTPDLGSIIKSPFSFDDEYAIIKYKAKEAGEETNDLAPVYFDVLSTDKSYPETEGNIQLSGNLAFWAAEYFGKDIYLKTYRSSYNVTYNEGSGDQILTLGAGYEITGIDGLKIVEAIVQKAWPSVNIINRTGVSTYELPLNFFSSLIDENIFGRHPYDALLYLADSLQCYIYFNRSGDLVIQKLENLGSNGESRSLVGKNIISGGGKKYMWDKVADGVTVSVKSWLNDANGDPILGEGTIVKKANIKPRNPLKKELIVSKAELTAAGFGIRANDEVATNYRGVWNSGTSYNPGDTVINIAYSGFTVVTSTKPKMCIKAHQASGDNLTSEYWTDEIEGTPYNLDYATAGIKSPKECLDEYAMSIAQKYFDFYGKRHLYRKLILDIDDEVLEWDLLDNITIDSVKYFILSMDIDVYDKWQVTFELVSVPAYDYSYSQAHIPQGENSRISQAASTYNSTYTPVVVGGSLSTISIKNFALDTDDVLAFRDGENAQETRIYNSYTDESNYERLALGYQNVSNVFTLQSEAAGSGTVRNLAFLGANNYGFGTTDFDGTPAAGKVVIKGTSNDGSDNILVGRNSDEYNVLEVDTSGQLKARSITNDGSTNILLGLNSLDEEMFKVDSLGNVVVTGDLTVMGTQFIANVETVEIEDNLLLINKNETGSGVTAGVAGIEVERGTLTNYQFLFNDASDTFRIGEVGDLQAVATREDSPTANSIMFWNDTENRLDSIDSFKWTGSNLTIDSSLGTSTYVSQLTGWQITNQGAADFRYIYTDELHAKAFIADLEQALAGSQIICKSVAKIATDFLLPVAGNTNRLIVESFGGFETAAVFQNGDLVRLRQFSRTSGSLNIADAWGTVVLDTTYGTSGFNTSNKTQAYLFTRHSTTGSATGIIEEGTLALDYGVSGNGFIESNAIDGMWAANSPYHQIVTWAGTPGNYTIHNRTGKLTGITDSDFGGTLPAPFGTYINGTAFIKGNIVVKATNALALQNNSIMIGNITGAANNAIKISNTGTTSTSGYFLYDASSNELLKFALDGNHHIANWNFDTNKFYKVSGNNKFALNTSSTAYIGNGQQGFEVYDISNTKLFVGAKDASGELSKGMDWNFTRPGELSVKGYVTASVLSTRDDLDFDDGILIDNWEIHNKQDVFDNWIFPYRIEWHYDGVERMRIGDIVGLQSWGLKVQDDLYLDVPDSIIPRVEYTTNIGTIRNKFLSVHAAELWVQTLVAQETVATIGGRVVVAPTNILIQSFPDWLTSPPYSANQVTIDVKYNNLSINDILYLESNGKIEFLKVTSSATSISGGYRYVVERNLDGTGVNDWEKGDALINTGQPGDGFIDIYSVSSMKGGTQFGPTIVGNIRTSTAYNGWTESWAIGNLQGLYGQSSSTIGVALGRYGSGYNHVIIDSANGIRFNNYNTTIGRWYGSIIELGDTNNHNLELTSTSITFKDGSIEYMKMDNSSYPLVRVGAESDKNVLVGSAGIFLRDASTVKVGITNTGLTIGQTGAGQSNVYISSGSLQLRNNTTPFITLDSTGTGYFFGNITSNATITGGIIRTNSSGARIEINSDNKIEFYGYDNYSSTTRKALEIYPEAFGAAGTEITRVNFSDGTNTFLHTAKYNQDLHLFIDGQTLFVNTTSGIYFGDSVLTPHLYASDASTIKTDDNFTIGGNLSVEGNFSLSILDVTSSDSQLGILLRDPVDNTVHSATDWFNYPRLFLDNPSTTTGAGVSLVLGTSSALAGITGIREGGNQQSLVFWTEDSFRNEVLKLSYTKNAEFKGGVKVAQFSDSSAPLEHIYWSTDAGKLATRTPDGTPHYFW